MLFLKHLVASGFYDEDGKEGEEGGHDGENLRRGIYDIRTVLETSEASLRGIHSVVASIFAHHFRLSLLAVVRRCPAHSHLALQVLVDC